MFEIKKELKKKHYVKDLKIIDLFKYMQLRSGKIVNHVDKEMFDAAETLISFHDKVEMAFINKKIPNELHMYKKYLTRHI